MTWRDSVPNLHVVHESGERDLIGAEIASADFLVALGVQIDSDQMRQTPRRMARSYAELLTPREFGLTTFDNEDYTELVILRGIRFHSLCQHHALPFVGSADVAYLPGKRLVGLSKLAWVVELFARRPQVQERMTTQIADWLVEQLDPNGVGVRIRAEHLCMSLRGVQAAGAIMTTSALRGQLADDPRLRHEWVMVTAGSGMQ
ncbi:MAG: GTP cyclohydrolase I [Egibacteraceae bacterium]